MDETRKTDFEPTHRRVIGPLDALAEHGAPPNQTDYQSPGPPPWAVPASRPMNSGHKWPARFAVVATVLGSVLVLLACLGVFALGQESRPITATSAVPPQSAVVTSGTCEKKVIGEYGLIATVTATNTTEKAQDGVLWVRWPVTGEAAQEFTREATLAPWESVEITVNENVAAERWFRIGSCSHGWTRRG